MPTKPIQFRPIGDNDRVFLGPQTWEKHPDGLGGYRPISPGLRGTLEIPCPQCGAVFLREGSEAAIRTTIFKCGECHTALAGPDAAVTPGKLANDGEAN